MRGFRLFVVLATALLMGVVLLGQPRESRALNGYGGGGAAAATASPVTYDILLRTAVATGACAASGTSSATASNSSTGDLLLFVGVDCSGSGTQTCPVGTSPQFNAATGGTTLTVCSRTATAGDSSAVYKITNGSNQLTMTVIDLYESVKGNTPSIIAVSAGKAAQTAPDFVSASSTVAALDLAFIGQQAATPSLTATTGYTAVGSTSTGLGAAYIEATSRGHPITWTGGSSSTVVSMLIGE